MNLILLIIVGLIAGWLAGMIMRGAGYGILGDILLGAIGGVIGGWIFSILGITAGGAGGSIIVAAVGAVVLIYIVRLVKGPA